MDGDAGRIAPERLPAYGKRLGLSPVVTNPDAVVLPHRYAAAMRGKLMKHAVSVATEHVAVRTMPLT